MASTNGLTPFYTLLPARRPSDMDHPPSTPYYLRSRWLVPMRRPPLEDGGLGIQGHRIQWVGPWKNRPHPTSHHQLDLGDVIVLPGLINSHTHLEFTSLAGFHPAPKSFSAWVHHIQQAKQNLTSETYLQAWKQGQTQLLQNGVTSAVNHESQWTLLPQLWAANRLRLWTCLEMTGVLAKSPPDELLNAALKHLETLPPSPLLQPGLAPHALYSTHPRLLPLAQKIAQQKKWILSTHLAESSEESELFLHQTGGLAEWLLPLHPGPLKKGQSPVQFALENGLLGPNLLAVHCNDITSDDVETLANTGVQVVHCPNSHRYFHHTPFPLHALLERGINVSLGTDSSATLPAAPETPSPTLNLFSELQTLSRKHPELAPKTLLDMVTLNPAQSLRRPHTLGCLQEGAYADWIAIPLTQAKTPSPYEQILWNPGPVTFSMIHGSWVSRNA